MSWKTIFKNSYVYLLAILVFAVAAVIYCSPAMTGKVLAANDHDNWVGASHELTEHAQEDGEGSWWTNSMFCGMPAYQIGGGATYKAEEYKAPINNILHKCIFNPVWAVFFYFVCFFILLLSFGLSPWLSLLGALITGLSSYFIVVITAGHNTKVAAIALTAVVLAGYKLIFDRKYIPGALLVMVFVASGYTLHPQMFYYYCLMMGLLWFAELWKHIKEKKLKTLAVSTAVFVVSFGVGIGTGMSNFFTNIEYMKESTRGGSDLAPYLTEEASPEESGSEQAPSRESGLNYEYATAWSYGIDETLTLMIPGFKGGSSNYHLSENALFRKEMKKRNCTPESIESTCGTFPMYWGPQPMTQGSVYVGAIICFLFVLGLFVVKGPYKWMLLLCTLFSVMLSWGNHFPLLTKFFFNCFPMYNKFRSVSSILIVAEIAMPVLALMALERILGGKVEKKELSRYILISAGITAGICLFFLLFGSMIYDFTCARDATTLKNFSEWVLNGVHAQRKALFNSDCLRSLLLILAAAGLLWLNAKGKVKALPAVLVVCLLSVVDLWGVDRRYLSDRDFVRPSKATATYEMTPQEKLILQDPSLNFRVMNLTVPTFSDSRTSYYLKSIGGYSAVKLSRYDDLINHDLKPMHMPVLNMLNTRYFLLKNGSDSVVVAANREAMGNAWWVSDIKVTQNPKEEIESLMEVNLRNTAIVGKDYADMAPTTLSQPVGSTVRLLKAEPNYLEYVTDSRKDGVVVFSEIFYPHGWQACIDGKPVPHFRANYVLRALNVPAGKHGITFTFDPPSVKTGDTIALVFIFIMYASIIAAIGYGIFTFVRSVRKPDRNS